MHCSEFHEWLIHLNKKHDSFYCPYSLVPDPDNFSNLPKLWNLYRPWVDKEITEGTSAPFYTCREARRARTTPAPPDIFSSSPVDVQWSWMVFRCKKYCTIRLTCSLRRGFFDVFLKASFLTIDSGVTLTTWCDVGGVERDTLLKKVIDPHRVSVLVIIYREPMIRTQVHRFYSQPNPRLCDGFSVWDLFTIVNLTTE